MTRDSMSRLLAASGYLAVRPSAVVVHRARARAHPRRRGCVLADATGPLRGHREGSPQPARLRGGVERDHGSQVYQDPNRLAQTQLEIARVPELAQRVIRQNGLQGDTAESFLDDSRVVAAANADILEFSVTASLPEVAEPLATAYAVEFTRYRSEVESAALTPCVARSPKTPRAAEGLRRRRFTAIREPFGEARTAPHGGDARYAECRAPPSSRRGDTCAAAPSEKRNPRRACSGSCSEALPSASPRRWTLALARAARSRPHCSFRSSAASRVGLQATKARPARDAAGTLGPRGERRFASLGRTSTCFSGTRIDASSW